MNCAAELLDRIVHAAGETHSDRRRRRIALHLRQLLARANRIAHVLGDDLELVPGNRVLLRGANNPMIAACWLAIIKAGGIAVATMPLLRAKELTDTVIKAPCTLALCDASLLDELEAAGPAARR